VEIKMKKQVKKYGDTLVISFNREEQQIYSIKQGTILDLVNMVIINKKGPSRPTTRHSRASRRKG